MRPNSAQSISYIWNLNHYKEVIAKSFSMLEESLNRVVISGYKEERLDFQEQPKHCVQRGGRSFNVVCDQKTVLTATITSNKTIERAGSAAEGSF